MGHRLSKIYTRTGDDGTTGLATGERVAKTDPRVAASGDVDEANSAIGLVLASPDVPADVRDVLLRVQNELFEVGGALSLPGYAGVSAEHTAALEADLDRLNADLPPLKEFVLPGGGSAAATCHLARAVCRRAERSAWAAAERFDVRPELLRYLNRLSDLLFVIARRLARASGRETLWRRG